MTNIAEAEAEEVASTPTTTAQQIQQAIDLRRQVVGLTPAQEAEIIFQDTSPPSHWEKIYSMVTGEEITVKRFRVEALLSRLQPNGKPAFTAYKDQAPKFVIGKYRCFLAEGSKERLSGVLEAVGLAGRAPCVAIHLASEFASTRHAAKKHKDEWTVVKDYNDRLLEAKRDERQEAQTEAMLKLAGMTASKDK